MPGLITLRTRYEQKLRQSKGVYGVGLEDLYKLLERALSLVFQKKGGRTISKKGKAVRAACAAYNQSADTGGLETSSAFIRKRVERGYIIRRGQKPQF